MMDLSELNDRTWTTQTKISGGHHSQQTRRCTIPHFKNGFVYSLFLKFTSVWSVCTWLDCRHVGVPSKKPIKFVAILFSCNLELFLTWCFDSFFSNFFVFINFCYLFKLTQLRHNSTNTRTRKINKQTNKQQKQPNTKTKRNSGKDT